MLKDSLMQHLKKKIKKMWKLAVGLLQCQLNTARMKQGSSLSNLFRLIKEKNNNIAVN